MVGLTINVILSASKFLAGITGHSHALVADAVESLTDVFSSLVVWRGLVVAAEPADEDHPYGHGKAEPLAAALVAILLLFAAVWIAYEAVHSLSEPRPAPRLFTLLVLIGVVGLKEGLFRFVHHESVSVQSPAVHADAWHHRADAITSLAAALGIVVALVGGKGYERADDIAAICAAVVVAWNGWRLLRPAVNDLMDRSPNREIVERVRRIAAETPGVEGVEKCRARKMGHQYYFDLHVEVDPQMTVQRSHEIAHDVKDNVRKRVPRVRDVLVHIEPARR
ncbi:MAG: cation-efflux pump [Verrucomicrobia bacterium]|nr:MAG: cation-efflux pump [Verrucomicrobiota bacterium]